MRSMELEGDNTKVQTRLELTSEVFAWSVRQAERASRKSRLEDALHWSIIAGEIAEAFGANRLASSELERLLIEAGRFVAADHGQVRKSPSNKVKWLHVLSRAYDTGGHTALCRRWIDLDPTADEHSVVLTFQDREKTPKNLCATVSAHRGEIEDLSAEPDLLSRAERLRTRAQEADVVVLHTHMWDPLPVISLADQGLPPVLLVNHADHTYWTGGSVADLILNIRPSGEIFCRAYRGKTRSFRFPLPLPTLPPQEAGVSRAEIRSSLGIPSDAIVFLTVGSAYKYKPTADLNFIDTAAKILKELPSAHLIAIGPRPDHPDWESAKIASAGRLIALGERTDLPRFYEAADIYLEGFPFGSLTALLEAVQAGLPPVLAPALVPLPYRSDDYSLQGTSVPSDISDYVSMSISLASSAQASRDLTASQLSEAVKSIHCEPGWTTHLLDLRNTVLRGDPHTPKPLGSIPELPREAAIFWARFLMERNPKDNPYSYAKRRAAEIGLEYRLDHALLTALSRASRSGLQVPQPSIEFLHSVASTVVPKKYAQICLRTIRSISSYIQWRINGETRK